MSVCRDILIANVQTLGDGKVHFCHCSKYPMAQATRCRKNVDLLVCIARWPWSSSGADAIESEEADDHDS
jgi:hypothetical protein